MLEDEDLEVPDECLMALPIYKALWEDKKHSQHIFYKFKGENVLFTEKSLQNEDGSYMSWMTKNFNDFLSYVSSLEQQAILYKVD